PDRCPGREASGRPAPSPAGRRMPEGQEERVSGSSRGASLSVGPGTTVVSQACLVEARMHGTAAPQEPRAPAEWSTSVDAQGNIGRGARALRSGYADRAAAG